MQLANPKRRASYLPACCTPISLRTTRQPWPPLSNGYGEMSSATSASRCAHNGPAREGRDAMAAVYCRTAAGARAAS
jgi:hypothetical protein